MHYELRGVKRVTVRVDITVFRGTFKFDNFYFNYHIEPNQVNFSPFSRFELRILSVHRSVPPNVHLGTVNIICIRNNHSLKYVFKSSCCLCSLGNIILIWRRHRCRTKVEDLDLQKNCYDSCVRYLSLYTCSFLKVFHMSLYGPHTNRITSPSSITR